MLFGGKLMISSDTLSDEIGAYKQIKEKQNAIAAIKSLASTEQKQIQQLQQTRKEISLELKSLNPTANTVTGSSLFSQSSPNTLKPLLLSSSQHAKPSRGQQQAGSGRHQLGTQTLFFDGIGLPNIPSASLDYSNLHADLKHQRAIKLPILKLPPANNKASNTLSSPDSKLLLSPRVVAASTTKKPKPKKGTKGGASFGLTNLRDKYFDFETREHSYLAYHLDCSELEFLQLIRMMTVLLDSDDFSGNTGGASKERVADLPTVFAVAKVSVQQGDDGEGGGARTGTGTWDYRASGGSGGGEGGQRGLPLSKSVGDMSTSMSMHSSVSFLSNTQHTHGSSSSSMYKGQGQGHRGKIKSLGRSVVGRSRQQQQPSAGPLPSDPGALRQELLSSLFKMQKHTEDVWQ